MEWVETTGRTIEDAKEAALDELGVDSQDAEFEILEEPKLGLFGRIRNEGRVRARVRPVSPPSKDDRRRRSRSGPKPSEPADDSPGREQEARTAVQTESSLRAAAPAKGPKRNGDRGRGSSGAGQTASSDSGSPARQKSRGSTQGEGEDMEVSLEDQGQAAEEFLLGLLSEFGVTAEITSSQPDAETLELALAGADLGTLIGPKGATLLAIQDLTRTVVQRKTGAGNGRIRVDVNGYRQKRSEALSRFAEEVAEQVKNSGVRKALEPMSAQDRKVVHDALTDVAGVSTVSEGEDAARRVVILPQDD